MTGWEALEHIGVFIGFTALMTMAVGVFLRLVTGKWS